MADNMNCRLIMVGPNPFFAAGTLFEIAASMLPDRGDGEGFEAEATSVVECRPFAENVPPGQCPVQITSFGPGTLEDVRLDETIHWQKLIVPVPIGSIRSIEVLDRARGFEADHYETPSGEETEPYELHIGHLRPGFYEALFAFSGDANARLTFIKHFPQSFAERAVPLAAGRPAIPERELPSGRESVRQNDVTLRFSPEVLNTALELSTEWGENFGKPITDRILAKFPQLSESDIAELTKISREAEYFIYSLADRELAGEISEAEIPRLAVEKHPWLNEQNTARLTGIGMFYARK